MNLKGLRVHSSITLNDNTLHADGEPVIPKAIFLCTNKMSDAVCIAFDIPRIVVFEAGKNIFEAEKNIFEVEKNIFEVEKNIFETF